MKDSELGGEKSATMSFDTVVERVTTIGNQVKEQVAIVFDRKLGKSNRSDDDHRYERLLSSSQSPRASSYGSFPPPPYHNGESSYLVSSQERKLSNGNPLHADNYLRDYADTLPKITVDKFSSAQHSTYVPMVSTKFASYINPEPQVPVTNFLTVDTSLKPGLNGYAGASGEFDHSSPSTTAVESNSSDEGEVDHFTWPRYLKIGIVLIAFICAAVMITITTENTYHFIQISASQDHPFSFPMKTVIPFSPWFPLLTVSVSGAFATPQYENTTTDRLFVSVQRIDSQTGESESVSEIWEIPILSKKTVSDLTLSHTFSMKNLSELFLTHDDDNFSLLFESTTEMSFPMFMSLKLLPKYIENGALFGGLVIVGLYILIIFELINRTLSAMLAATVAIGILSTFNERPTTEELVSWLDMETLILLFSMMLMVSILCETGFFNYCAFIMYKITNGAIWPMLTSLCLFTAVVSAFLDNVTTILLMTPVTIRICEAMRLNPVPVLISIVIFSNIGGAATPVGDPPNAIIANDPDVIKAGIDFTAFVTHMTIGIILVMIVSYVHLRIMFRSMSSLQFEVPYEIAELKREIEVWTRAVASLSSYSRDESHVKTILQTKVLHLKSELKSKKRMGGQTEEGYRATLAELEESCRIKDWPLLIKCGIVLTLVIIIFFLQSIPELKLSIGWTALLGAVLLLTLADRKEIDGILTRIEWSTLVFFSALFIVMEAVSRLGLLDWIGTQTETVILHVNPESRTIVAILIILWVSGLASAFIDNIPFTTMMIKIVTRLASSLSLPLHPLVWALAFGTCLGGNGTLIGASANVVCAGVADQHGYRFSFVEYFRIGFPMMLISLIIASAYLTVCYYIGFF